MSIIAVVLTIRCDWLNCGGTLVLPQGEGLDEHGWEYRAKDVHVCPKHVDKSLDDMIAEESDE